MAVSNIRARDKDSLAQFLGWFSLGLGAAQVSAPKLMCKLVGARGDGAAPTVMRLMGAREVTQGLGILARPRPTGWVRSRVAGDALDLALLGVTAVRGVGPKRTAFAIANVLPIAAADYYESKYLGQKTGPVRAAQRIRKAVTINKSRDDVEAAWVEAEELRRKVDAAGAAVSIHEAPGNRGVELAVDFDYKPMGGDLGAAVQKLTGNDLATQLADDLRRFKQRVETGEVTRSDSTPSGHLLSDHLKQRAAQPLEEVHA